MRWMDREARDKKKRAVQKECAKLTVAGMGRSSRNHNVILTEITPSHLPRDNKFATFSLILE